MKQVSTASTCRMLISVQDSLHGRIIKEMSSKLNIQDQQFSLTQFDGVIIVGLIWWTEV